MLRAEVEHVLWNFLIGNVVEIVGCKSASKIDHIGVQLGPARVNVFTFSINGLAADIVGQRCTPMVGLRPRLFTDITCHHAHVVVEERGCGLRVDEGQAGRSS
jgi:hypothetical protein